MPAEAKVEIYTTPPEPLVQSLKTHVPHSLPLLRRLEFTRLPGDTITPHTRIFWASSVPLDSYFETLSRKNVAKLDKEVDDDVTAPPKSMARFAAGYLDFSRGPETELWLYSSMEHTRPGYSRFTGPSDASEQQTDLDAKAGGAAEEDGEEEIAECTSLAASILREVKRHRDLYDAEANSVAETNFTTSGDKSPPPRREQDTVLLGTLNEFLRRSLVRRCGMVFPYVEELYDKWLFRVEDLPPAPGLEILDPGMRWDKVRREDIPFVLSRNHIPRRERTVVMLPSTAIYLEGNTPIAWSFLGPDSSLSSLHCEEGYRRRGLAKAVAVKLLRDHLTDYDDEGYGWADVALENKSSQGLCKSLGSKIGWTIAWSRIDLDQSFPDQ